MDDVKRLRIEKRAYHIWEMLGRPAGKSLDCWVQAELLESIAVSAERTTRYAEVRNVAQEILATWVTSVPNSIPETMWVAPDNQPVYRYETPTYPIGQPVQSVAAYDWTKEGF
jgi:hypothetical protein